MAKMKYWDGNSWVVLDAKDADTLDGKHASNFADAAQFKNHIDNHPKGFSGNYNDLTNKPTSMPANGGNADTVDGKHASDFANAKHSHSMQEINGLDELNLEYNIVKSLNIEGRTLINLLGRAGNHIYSQIKAGDRGSVNISTTRQGFVFKKINTSSSFILNWSEMKVLKGAGKCFVCLAEVATQEDTDVVSMTVSYGHAQKGQFKSGGSKYKTIYCAAKIKDDESYYLDFSSTATKIGAEHYIRNIRVYETTEDVFNKIENDTEFSGAGLIEKFPYVDDIEHINNPFFIIKQNLLSGKTPVKGWTFHNAKGLDLAYPSGENDNVRFGLPGDGKVFGGKVHTLGCDGDFSKNSDISCRIDAFAYGGTAIETIEGWDRPFTGKLTFTAPKEADFVKIAFKKLDDSEFNSSDDKLLLSQVFSLVEGDTYIPDSKCEDSRMSFDVSLGDGETLIQDENNNYLKLSRWENISILGEENSYKVNKSIKDHKIIEVILPYYVNIKGSYDMPNDALLITYDGRILRNSKELTEEGFFMDKGKLLISIPNRLSGWGDNYEPDEPEIRSYFYGYKLFGEEGNLTWENWNGQPNKTKVWARLWTGMGDYEIIAGASIATRSELRETPISRYNKYFSSYKLHFRSKSSSLVDVETHGELRITPSSKIAIGAGLVNQEYRSLHNCEGMSKYEFLTLINCDHEYLKNRPRQILTIKNDKGCLINFIDRLGHYGYEDYYVAQTHGHSQAAFKGFRDDKFYLVDYIMLDTVTSFKYKMETSNLAKDAIPQNKNNMDTKMSPYLTHSKIEKKINTGIMSYNGDFTGDIDELKFNGIWCLANNYKGTVPQVTNDSNTNRSICKHAMLEVYRSISGATFQRLTLTNSTAFPAYAGKVFIRNCSFGNPWGGWRRLIDNVEIDDMLNTDSAVNGHKQFRRGINVAANGTPEPKRGTIYTNTTTGELEYHNGSGLAQVMTNENYPKTLNTHYLKRYNLNELSKETIDNGHPYCWYLDTTGAGPWDWSGILNLSSGHFISQIALSCVNGTTSDVKMAIRTKYMPNEKFSDWVEFAKKSTVLEAYDAQAELYETTLMQAEQILDSYVAQAELFEIVLTQEETINELKNRLDALESIVQSLK